MPNYLDIFLVRYAFYTLAVFDNFFPSRFLFLITGFFFFNPANFFDFGHYSSFFPLG